MVPVGPATSSNWLIRFVARLDGHVGYQPSACHGEVLAHDRLNLALTLQIRLGRRAKEELGRPVCSVSASIHWMQ